MTGEFDRPDRFGWGGIASAAPHSLLRARAVGLHRTDRLLTLPADPAPGCGIPVVITVGVILVLLIMLQGPALANAFRTLTGFFAPNPPANTGGGGGGASASPSAGPAGEYRGPGTIDDVPYTSDRDLAGGDAPVTVTGAFSLDATFALASDFYSNQAAGAETALVYGTMDSDGFTLAFSREEGSEGLGLNLVEGDWRANYLGQGCTWEVRVTDVSVSGHISCTDVPATNEANGSTGTVDIELDFSADSPPTGSSSGGLGSR